MAVELEPVVRRLYKDFDNLDFETVRGYITDDAQGVDEISRRWIRGVDGIAEYFAQLRPMLSEVQSEVSDLHETVWGDIGLVTFWIEQSYVLSGDAQRVSAPTTMLFRREGGDWKIVLIHSVPLPTED